MSPFFKNVVMDKCNSVCLLINEFPCVRNGIFIGIKSGDLSDS